jgi:hypothetical protein
MSDLSPKAEELLKRARESFSPDEARVAALRAAVGARLGPSLPSKGPAEGAAAKVAGIGTATKLAGVGVLLVASAVGVRMLAGRTHGEPPLTAAPSASLAAKSISCEPPRAEPRQPQEPPSISVGDLPSAQPDPIATGRTILPASPSHGRVAVEKGAAVVSMSSATLARASPPSPPREVSPAEPEAQPGPASVSDAPGSGRGAAGATANALAPPSHGNDGAAEPAVASAPTAAAPRPADAALGEEIGLLRAARHALDGGDAAGALTLLDRYERAYPSGTLQEESLATRALTLCALGLVASAKDVARRLEATAPRSPHLVRVRASCAGDNTRSK